MGDLCLPLLHPKSNPRTGQSCFSNRALVHANFEAPNAFKNSVSEASKMVSTKTLLLKHCYCSQGSKRQSLRPHWQDLSEMS